MKNRILYVPERNALSKLSHTTHHFIDLRSFTDHPYEDGCYENFKSSQMLFYNGLGIRKYFYWEDNFIQIDNIFNKSKYF